MTRPLRVLILEDSPADAELAMAELRRGGFDPDWQLVDTEPEYAARLSTELDIILADFSVPGFDMLRALDIAIERTPETPFLIVSGAIAPRLAVECVKRGASDYVLKNELERLPQTITAALEQRRLRAEAESARTALANSEKQARQLASDEATLAEIGRLITSSLELGEVFSRARNLILRLVPSSRLSIAMIDRLNGTLFSLKSSGLDVPEWHTEEPQPLDGTIAERVAETGVAQLVNIASPEAFLDEFPGMAPLITAIRLRSLIGVPLISRDEVFGVLHFSTQADAGYSERELKLAEQIGRQITGAIANAQLHEIVERQAREEALLAEIGRVVTASPNIEDVYGNVCDLVNKLIPTDSIVCLHIDDSTNSFRVRHAWGLEIPDHGPGATGNLEGSVSLHVAETRRSQLVTSVEDQPEFVDRFPGTAPVLQAGIQSMMTCPLIADERTLGALAIQSRTAGMYGPSHLALAERVAAQIAGAIANAELHAEIAQQAHQEAVLSEIGRVVSSSGEIDSIFDQFVEQLRRLIPADRVAISLIDREAGTFTNTYVSGLSAERRGIGVSIPLEGSATAEVASTRRVLILDGRDDPAGLLQRFPQLDHLLDAGFRSFLSAPLLFRGEVRGVLHLRSRKPGAFSLEHPDLAERIAAQIAGAIVNAALNQEVEQRAREEEALAEIGRVLTASPNIEDVFGRFGELVNKLIPTDTVMFNVIDRPTDRLQVRHAWGRELEHGRKNGAPKLAETLSLHVAETKRCFLVTSTDDHPELGERFPGMSGILDAGVRSLVFCPVIADDTVLGTFVALSWTRGTYGPGHAALSERIAAQISGAIANAELRSEVERISRENSLLAEIGRIANSAEVGRIGISDSAGRKLFAQLAERMVHLIPMERLSVDSVDIAAGVFQVRAIWGAEVPSRVTGSSMPLEGHMAGSVVSTNQTILIGDVEAQPDVIDRFPGLKPGIARGIRSFLSAPMFYRDEIIGVLHVRSSVPNAFTSKHVALLERVSAQISGATANATLREEAEVHAREDSILARIGRLVSGSLDFASSFDELAASVAELIPYDRFAIMGFHADANVYRIEFVAGREIPGWAPGASHAVEDQDWCAENWPREGKRWESDPGMTPHENVAIACGLLAGAVVPMISDNDVIGFISVRTEALGRLTDHHLALLERVSRQIAGSYMNARLYAMATMAVGEANVRTAAIEAASDMAVIADAAGNVLYVNEAYVRSTGFSREETIGKNLVKLMPDKYREQHTHAFSEIANKHDSKIVGSFIEVEALRKDGPTIPVELGVTEVDLPAGIHYVGIMRDLTDRIAADREREHRRVLDEENRELERALEYKNRFVSSVSHELKTPLASLMACVALLSGDSAGDDDPGRTQAIGIMDRSARQLNVLINDLVDASRLAEGKLELSLRDFDINDLCIELLKDMAPVLDAKGQAAQFQLSGDELVISGDRSRITQVISNLVSNASKYSDAGSSVRVSTRRDDDYVVISVRDDGIGISEEDKKQLFAPYFRGKSVEVRSVPGTGLGLFISRELIRAHGGEIKIQSQEGVGTSVEFRLPIRDDHVG